MTVPAVAARTRAWRAPTLVRTGCGTARRHSAQPAQSQSSAGSTSSKTGAPIGSAVSPCSIRSMRFPSHSGAGLWNNEPRFRTQEASQLS